MSLIKRIRAYIPHAVIFPGEPPRPIADLFEVEDGAGYVYADLGWSEPLNTTHPFHAIPGELKGSGSGPWTIGDARIVELDEQDDQIPYFIRWWHYLRTLNEKKHRKACIRCIETSFSIKLIP